MSQNKRDRQPSRPRSLVLLAGLAALIIIFSSTFVHLLTEAWWFEAVGFSQVFWTLLLWRSLVWVGTFAIFTLFLWANYAFAMRVTRYSTISFLEGSQLQNYSRHLPRFLMPVGIVIVALTVAGVSVEAWETILKYLNATPFERNDPIYGRDLGFYVFQLPFADANAAANILRKVSRTLRLELSRLSRGALTRPQRFKLWSAKQTRSNAALAHCGASA